MDNDRSISSHRDSRRRRESPSHTTNIRREHSTENRSSRWGRKEEGGERMRKLSRSSRDKHTRDDRRFNGTSEKRHRHRRSSSLDQKRKDSKTESSRAKPKLIPYDDKQEVDELIGPQPEMSADIQIDDSERQVTDDDDDSNEVEKKEEPKLTDISKTDKPASDEGEHEIIEEVLVEDDESTSSKNNPDVIQDKEKEPTDHDSPELSSTDEQLLDKGDSGIGKEIAAMESIQDEVMMMNVSADLPDVHTKESVVSDYSVASDSVVDLNEKSSNKITEATSSPSSTKMHSSNVKSDVTNAATKMPSAEKIKTTPSPSKSAVRKDSGSKERRRSRSRSRRSRSRKKSHSKEKRPNRSKERKRSHSRERRSLSRSRRRSRSRDRGRRSRSREYRNRRSPIGSRSRRSDRRSSPYRRRRSRSTDRRRSRRSRSRGRRSVSNSPRRRRSYRSRSRSRSRHGRTPPKRRRRSSDDRSPQKSKRLRKRSSSSSSSSAEERTKVAKRRKHSTTSSSSESD